ncbi:MAG: hypothetical protein EOP07_15215 [Proteobacteria bacterium]|nr:MAG: hypothetical protein EOP07_15215 [Pseudomonadota bacterium]
MTMRVLSFMLIALLSVNACKTTGFKGGTAQTPKPNNSTDITPKPPVVEPPLPLFVECPGAPDRMLVAGLYLLPENTAALPDFKKMTKVKDVCLKQLDVTDRDFKEGFPLIPDLIEWFGLDVNFRVNVPEDGEYKFMLNSDDGSILAIDGKEVINNDGLHPHQEVAGKATLTKGWHDFNVKYYEGPRYRIALELFWQKPGASTREYIPEALFSRPKL